MDTRKKALEIIAKFKQTDGIVITKETIVEHALKEAYDAGLRRAALYVAEEIGQERLAREITHLT